MLALEQLDFLDKNLHCHKALGLLENRIEESRVL